MSDMHEISLRSFFSHSITGEWGSEPIGNKDVTVFRAADFTKDCKLRRDGGVLRAIPPSKLNARRLENNDILIEKSGGSPDQPVGRAVLFEPQDEDQVAACSNFIQRMVVKECYEPLFVYYLLLFLYEQNATLPYQQQTTGIINLKLDEYLELQVKTYLNRSVQTQIASILKSVDQQIALTLSQIEKMTLLKQGMMADLFSRGIDPATGQLRPRATDDPSLYYLTPLGLLPTTWEAVPLKVVCDLQVGFAFKSEFFVEEGVSLLRGENVGFGYPIWKERRCLPKHVAEQYSEYKLAVGDLVIGMDRTFTKSGVKISRLGLVDVPSLLVQRVGRFIPFGLVDGLIDHVLKQEQYLRALTIAEQGMDIPHLSKEDILSPFVAVPKCSLEAEMIAKRLKTIQLYIEHEETQKQKLISQKVGLMRDLLTGKVPVSA